MNRRAAQTVNRGVGCKMLQTSKIIKMVANYCSYLYGYNHSITITVATKMEDLHCCWAAAVIRESGSPRFQRVLVDWSFKILDETKNGQKCRVSYLLNPPLQQKIESLVQTINQARNGNELISPQFTPGVSGMWGFGGCEYPDWDDHPCWHSGGEVAPTQLSTGTSSYKMLPKNGPTPLTTKWY